MPCWQDFLKRMLIFKCCANANAVNTDKASSPVNTGSNLNSSDSSKSRFSKGTPGIAGFPGARARPTAARVTLATPAFPGVTHAKTILSILSFKRQDPTSDTASETSDRLKCIEDLVEIEALLMEEESSRSKAAQTALHRLQAAQDKATQTEAHVPGTRREPMW